MYKYVMIDMYIVSYYCNFNSKFQQRPLDKYLIFLRKFWIDGVHRNGLEINFGRHYSLLYCF